MIVYRQTCNKRRRMTLSHTKDDDSRKFAEERRLMFLLGKPHPNTINFYITSDPSIVQVGTIKRLLIRRLCLWSGINHFMPFQVAPHCCSWFVCLRWPYYTSPYPRRISRVTLIKWVFSMAPLSVPFISITRASEGSFVWFASSFSHHTRLTFDKKLLTSKFPRHAANFSRLFMHDSIKCDVKGGTRRLISVNHESLSHEICLRSESWEVISKENIHASEHNYFLFERWE